MTRQDATPARRQAWWTALALAGVAFAYFSLFRAYGLNLPDEGTLLHKFERLADGERLYSDFHAGYTPGVFHVHAFLQGSFGQSILPGRVVLAMVNSLSIAMLYLLAAPLAGSLYAAAGALLYAAFMPVHPGHFASFNIPYPTWYSVAIFLAGLLAARAFSDGRRGGKALVVGLLAGLGFFFKPNIGAFQLAAGMLIVMAALPRRGPALTVAFWWGTWVGVLVGVFAVFGGLPGLREVSMFLVAVLGAAWLSAQRAGERASAASALETIAPILLVGGGFAAVTLAWLGAYATSVPFAALLEEALFVGSDYASFFYLPHPAVLLRALALAVAFVAVYWMPQRSLLPRAVTAGLFGIAVVVLGVVLGGRPMLHGFVASVMSEIETTWAYAAAIAAMWLLLGVAFARSSSSASNRSSALAVLAIGAPFLYLGNYPRTDYMHWVWAAPLAVAATAVLAALVARAWQTGLGNVGRGLVAAVVLAPVLLLGGLRVATGLRAVLRFDEQGPAYRDSVALGAERAPLWMNIGRAESYRDLEAVVRALRELTEPGEKVFTFPALDVVSYLSDRPTPVRDSYFFPRWIGRDDELAALRALEAAPPRFVVVLHDDWTFFSDAPSYYTALGDFVHREYRHYLQEGRYAILAHRSVGEPAPDGFTVERGAPDLRLTKYLDSRLQLCCKDKWATRLADIRYDAVEGYYPVLTDRLTDEDVAVRAAAVSALRHATDTRVGAALANAANVTEAGALPERERQLALRLAGAWAPRERTHWFGGEVEGD